MLGKTMLSGLALTDKPYSLEAFDPRNVSVQLPPGGCSCSEPEYNNLIGLMGYSFLIETLELDEETLAMVNVDIELPMSASNRKRLKEDIISHTLVCTSCQMAISLDRQLDIWVDDFLKKDPLKETLG